MGLGFKFQILGVVDDVSTAADDDEEETASFFKLSTIGLLFTLFAAGVASLDLFGLLGGVNA